MNDSLDNAIKIIRNNLSDCLNIAQGILQDFFEMQLQKNFPNDSWKTEFYDLLRNRRNTDSFFKEAWKEVEKVGIENYDVSYMDSSLIIKLITGKSFSSCCPRELTKHIDTMRKLRNGDAHIAKLNAYDMNLSSGETIKACQDFTIAVMGLKDGETIAPQKKRESFHRKYQGVLLKRKDASNKAFYEYVRCLVICGEIESSREQIIVNNENQKRLSKTEENASSNETNKDSQIAIDGFAEIKKAGKAKLRIYRYGGERVKKSIQQQWSISESRTTPQDSSFFKKECMNLKTENIGKFVHGRITIEGYCSYLDAIYGPITMDDFLPDIIGDFTVDKVVDENRIYYCANLTATKEKVEDIKYQWNEDGRKIDGATDQIYFPTEKQLGKNITCTAIVDGKAKRLSDNGLIVEEVTTDRDDVDDDTPTDYSDMNLDSFTREIEEIISSLESFEPKSEPVILNQHDETNKIKSIDNQADITIPFVDWREVLTGPALFYAYKNQGDLIVTKDVNDINSKCNDWTAYWAWVQDGEFHHLLNEMELEDYICYNKEYKFNANGICLYYKYYSKTYKKYNMTPDIWMANQIDPNFAGRWVWIIDGEIDHVANEDEMLVYVTNPEMHKLRPFGAYQLYRYYSRSKKQYLLTTNVWVADQIDPKYTQLWVWYKNGEFDHVLTATERQIYINKDSFLSDEEKKELQRRLKSTSNHPIHDSEESVRLEFFKELLKKETLYSLDSLTKEEREELDVRVGIRISNELSAEEIKEYDQLLGTKESAIWLRNHVPNYRSICNEEELRFYRELAQKSNE